MNSSELRDLVASYSVKAIESADTRAGCRIELPISEPGGDSIGVVVKKLDGGVYRVHDGGHIGGLLFQASSRGPSPSYACAVRALLRDSDLSEDPETGIAFADVDARAVPYWAYEIGRVIAAAASIAPLFAQPRAQSAADGETQSSDERRDGDISAENIPAVKASASP